MLNLDTSLNLTVCTMYPLHLNYTTTVPYKTITMKITIFLIVLVLKSNKNMEIWHFRLSQLHTSSKPCEKRLFKDVFKVSASRFQPFTQARSFLTKLSMALLVEFCGRASHIVCETFFSSSTVFGLDMLNMVKIYEILTT